MVDPGVGSARRAVILATPDGSHLVGPDNGLLPAAAECLGGVDRAYEITNPSLGPAGRSSTFHGRDVFAPAAAHLWAGVPLEQFGPPVEVGSLVAAPNSPYQEVELRADHVRGRVIRVDRFGNVRTNLPAGALAGLGLTAGERVEVRLGDRVLFAVWRTAYSQGAEGELLLIKESHNNLELSVNRGSALALIGGVVAGQELLVGVEGFAG